MARMGRPKLENPRSEGVFIRLTKDEHTDITEYASSHDLTLGITPDLHIISQSILILLMYLGRVGGLTLIYAMFSDKNRKNAKLPTEKITVG